MSADIYPSILSHQKEVLSMTCEARWLQVFSGELRVLEPGHACCVVPFRRTDCSHSTSPPNQGIDAFQDEVSAG